jgi:hypothetical protein
MNSNTVHVELYDSWVDGLTNATSEAPGAFALRTPHARIKP